MLRVNKKQTGFTLVEVAIVLVIVGLLIGSFIGTVASRIDMTLRNETSAELEEIKNVLMAYAFSKAPQPYLPCPDITVPPDGLEDRTMGICDAVGAVGTLPWRDLGLGFDDAWGARYRYWVSSNYTDSNTGFTLASADVGGGNSLIQTRLGDVNTNIVQNAVAVIFSHGKNGLGGVSVSGINLPPIPAVGNGHDDENENVDANSVFMSRLPSEEGSAAIGGVYDDILIWINSYEIKAKMVATGVLP